MDWFMFITTGLCAFMFGQSLFKAMPMPTWLWWEGKADMGSHVRTPSPWMHPLEPTTPINEVITANELIKERDEAEAETHSPGTRITLQELEAIMDRCELIPTERVALRYSAYKSGMLSAEEIRADEVTSGVRGIYLRQPSLEHLTDIKFREHTLTKHLVNGQRVPAKELNKAIDNRVTNEEVKCLRLQALR